MTLHLTWNPFTDQPDYTGAAGGNVPLVFHTPDGDGSAVGNTINILPGPGIDTYVNPDGSNNVYISLQNGCEDTAQTIGATTATIVCIAMGNIPGTMLVRTSVSAFCVTGGPLSAGYDITACVRTDGATATLIGTPDKLVFEEGALSAANATIGVSGNNVVITVTGVAGKTINWAETSSGKFTS